MKRYLINVLVFCSLLIAGIVWVVNLADGHTDPYYLKFTTPVQSNLIVGTSRAAQGVLPAILHEHLGRIFYNYSFTNSRSPYGPVYFESIKKKVDPNEKNGIFIVTVDPWCLSSKTEDPDDLANFRELGQCVDNMSKVAMNPNFIYLFNEYSGKYYSLLYSRSEELFLHDDGWLEISIPMDTASINSRTEFKINAYKKLMSKYRFSPIRVEYLSRIIEYLIEHGKVYLVRLPVSPDMFKIETELMPDLDQNIKDIIPNVAGYYDMTPFNDEFNFTDGNHLHKSSAQLVSMKLADWINNN